jgi:hypothetical protein
MRSFNISSCDFTKKIPYFEETTDLRPKKEFGGEKGGPKTG